MAGLLLAFGILEWDGMGWDWVAYFDLQRRLLLPLFCTLEVCIVLELWEEEKRRGGVGLGGQPVRYLRSKMWNVRCLYGL